MKKMRVSEGISEFVSKSELVIERMAQSHCVAARDLICLFVDLDVSS